MATIRIATRKSQLALWQAKDVRARLLKHHRDLEVVLCEIVSEGDRSVDAPLSLVGGKGLFLKELEQALLRGEADLAVHSMKDVPVTLPSGLHIGAICPRDDPRDVFVANAYEEMAQLQPGAVIGTCSLRRQCQLRARYPHLRFVNLRGNVNTRLARLDRDEDDADDARALPKLDGIVLAAAGLKRLDLAHRITEYLAPEICLPAVGQGAVGIECRADDDAMRALIRPLNHADTAVRVTAERAANEGLGGGCHVPLAVYAELAESPETKSDLRPGTIGVRGMVGTVDGTTLLRSEEIGARADAAAVGYAVAASLRAQGASEILQSIYAG